MCHNGSGSFDVFADAELFHDKNFITALVRVVAHGAQDDAGDAVAGGNLAYSSAFHLHAVGLAFVLDSLFGGGIANKKVTGGNLAGNGLNTTGVACVQCGFDQGQVAVVLCGERCALGNHVILGVVIYHGFAHADITNADLAGHVACNAGEDDLLGTVLGN